MNDTASTKAGVPDADVPARRWHFGNAVFDERVVELVVDGRVVEIERKPLEVLVHLLEHAGDVVTKDELFAAVWPGRILTEHVITKAIGRLREVLGDGEPEIIKTVQRFGYRLVASVRVESAARRVAPAHFDFKQGDHPPLRPLWSLVERLGAGGQGEAWLVRHDKTKERRVLKFAKDEGALGSLKREVTLFRLLSSSLGSRAQIVTILDWNFEQIPFFIESEYMPGGSLADWAHARGGIATVGLEDRLEIIARIADALAAVHSVGVLHKDLKPSNILVDDEGGGAPAIRLGDLGSGGILDAARLEAMRITRLGFTQTAAISRSNSGTPLYLAPELISGQPPTVQADIYALGVMLYQIVVGDFHRGMSPGWERDIEDEILREDIAMAASGDSGQRLGDVGELARRLRALPSRRVEREAARRAAADAEEEKRARDRWRSLRAGLIVALGVLCAGLAASSVLYVRARHASVRAEDAAIKAQTVTNFLSEDVLNAINSGEHSVKNLTMKELLDAASQQAGQRFGSDPETRARVDIAIGRSYRALELTTEAKDHLDQALAYYEGKKGPASAITVQLASDLLPLTFIRGTMRQEMPHFESILAAAARELGPTEASVLALRTEIARNRVQLGDWMQGASELDAALQDGRRAGADAATLATTEIALGYVLDELARFGEAETHLRNAAEVVGKLRGPDHLDVARARLRLGWVLVETRRYAEADAELSAAQRIADGWVEASSGYLHANQLYRARMWAAQGDPGRAIPVMETLLQQVAAVSKDQLDETWGYREPLALAYEQARRLPEAAVALRTALDSAASALGPDHPRCDRMRIELADVLRQLDQREEAWKALRPNGQLLDLHGKLPSDHPVQGDLLRVEGLLLKADGRTQEARRALTESLHIEESRRPVDDVRIRMAQALVDQLP